MTAAREASIVLCAVSNGAPMSPRSSANSFATDDDSRPVLLLAKTRSDDPWKSTSSTCVISIPALRSSVAMEVTVKYETCSW